MSRDMTVFVDDDGKAYHIYSSEENLTLNIAELNSGYNAHTGKYIRIFLPDTTRLLSCLRKRPILDDMFRMHRVGAQ